ncbi:glycosyltransferase family 2 protein [Oceaniferula spumae]
MQISFIIPIYNGSATLRRAVDSVFASGSDCLEVVIVDDGSVDETADICAQLEQAYPGKVVSVYQENQGAAASRNHGLQIAQGEWLWFLDCDDEVTPTGIAHFREYIAQRNELDVVIGGYEVRWPHENHRQGPGRLYDDKAQRVIDFLFKKKLRPTHGSIVVHRRLIDRLCYTEKMRQWEDIPVFVRLLLSDRVGLTEHCLSILHRSETSLRHNATHTAGTIETLVDEVFKIANLPDEVIPQRARYTASRYFSASRIILRAGRKKEARQCFWRGVQAYPLRLLSGRSLRFLLRAYLP